MPLITCPECNHHPVSTHAERCTKCGMPVEKMFTSGSANKDSHSQSACNSTETLHPITDIDLIVSDALIDAQTAQIVIRAKAIIGRADGSPAKEVNANFYVNDNPISAVVPDGNGNLILDARISPEFCRKGTNNLTVRVDGVARNKSVSFELLKDLDISWSVVDWTDHTARDHDGYYEYPGEEYFNLGMKLSRRDFVNVGEVNWMIMINGERKVSKSATSDSDGLIDFRFVNRYKSRHYSDGRDRKLDYLGLDLADTVSLLLEGFPVSFRIESSR